MGQTRILSILSDMLDFRIGGDKLGLGFWVA